MTNIKDEERKTSDSRTPGVRRDLAGEAVLEVVRGYMAVVYSANRGLFDRRVFLQVNSSTQPLGLLLSI
jgi:hypothetical protein